MGMILDYRNTCPPNMPHEAFDADGVSIWSETERVFWIDTKTGECRCYRFDANGTPVVDIGGDDVETITKHFKPPMRVVDCYGNEVTDGTLQAT